ncbi:single-stranded DNA-binding protein [Megalodesulfovibrio gigas]|uniref:Single-stranded DNA-binding protein n=1 Tax=Megalodesulfovibrio gigas (strain ATCC 19364 / DSM 1382 / NCIMB 9332 / VKM B-1759) TaxID=1121448 RepID=T2GG32_MEGG1|nr:single-stranded DNA-binding protein [Megalodesulfovibrio gigas]AGW15126.1 putative single-strand binding protein [Megalodesulfovibrio gigas DSM 1382 = ATCC 19364]
MAPTLNKVMLIGRLGRDPELRYTNSGKPVANFSIATDESYNDRDGNRVDKAEWHDIVVWDRSGENCANYLRKGSLVYVEGRLQTRKWQDQQGNPRKSTEVVADRVQFLDSKGSREAYDGPEAPAGYGDEGEFPPPPGQRTGNRPQQGGYQQGGAGRQQPRPQPAGQQPPRRPQAAPQQRQDEDLGPAFPSEASSMDDMPF